MSQFSHPTTTVRSQLQAHRANVLAGLLALLATAAVVLIFAIDDGPSTNSVAGQSQPVVRSNGGPNEASVAAAISSRPSTGPSESRIAASVGGAGTTRATGGPDESSVAASLSQASQPRHAGPDESATAAAISGR